MDRKRILFVAEAVSLAHVGRPLALAAALDPERYDIHFACAPAYAGLMRDTPFAHRSIHSIPPARFLDALARGSPLYDEATLAGYLAEDLRLLETVRPDLVVGDFRLSLSVSARLAGVPYAAIANAHWSPYNTLGSLPFPEHPLGKVLGVRLAGLMFHMAAPLVLARHALPLNQLRRRHGLPALGDLRQVYTDADHTLYADPPGLIPTRPLPANHHFIGPILWSPEVPAPPWWGEVPTDRPLIYLTLGSTGQVRALPALLDELGSLPVYVLLATAGRADLDGMPANVFASDYLPGSAAARRAHCVICNGGSATVYQALAEGAPVLGIASNLDQHLTMRAVSHAGAGIRLRSERIQATTLRSALGRLLDDPGLGEAARKVALACAGHRAGEGFAALLPRMLQAD